MVKVFYLSSESIDFEKFANKSYWYDSHLGDNDAFENQIAAGDIEIVDVKTVDIEIVDVKAVDIEIVDVKADNNLEDIREGKKEVSK